MPCSIRACVMPRRDMADTTGRSVWKTLLRGRSARVGMFLVVLFLFVAVSANWISPHSPYDFVGDKFERPSHKHWLGTDALGRDILSRVLFGTRLSLLAGVVSVLVAVGLGATSGAVAGYCGGFVEAVILRIMDILLSFPGVLIALLVVAALSPGWTAVILAVGFMNIPLFARQVRATVLTIRGLDYVVAARASGAGPWYMLLRVILPALATPVIVLSTLGLGTAILEVAGLSFLGLAGSIEVPEWGGMLNSAKETLRTSLWPALAPGVAISLTVLGFNLLGDGLRDALDPRLYRRG